MVNFTGPMEEFIRVTGRMENKMEKEFIKEVIKCREKANGLMEN